MIPFLAQAADQGKGLLDNLLLDEWQIPFGQWMDQSVDWIAVNLDPLLKAIKWPFDTLIGFFVDDYWFSLENISWVWVVLAMGLIAALVRNIKVGVFVTIALTVCGLLGNAYWLETARTIGFIGVAVFLCVLIGIPVGVMAGRIDGVWQVVRPILDAMQVVHSFVYMLPFIFFWRIGPVSATMVTMIFALPPLIRLTNLGIRQVPEDVVEASRAYGAPEWRVLFDVQLPLARPAIMTGINQTLLLAISMLGIAAIMGAGGLGRLLFQALSNQDVAQASSGGLAFFLVAVVLDRMSQRESTDTGNLFHRIRAAWTHRRDPEALIPADDDTPAVVKFESTERFAPISAAERMPIALTGIGGLVAALSVFLTWTTDAGKYSAFGRLGDSNRPGSYSGLDATGGSWFGIVTLGLAIFVILAVIEGYRRPGRGARWLAADGAVVGAVAMLLLDLAYFVGRAYDLSAESVTPGTGIGVYLALLGSIAAVVGAVMWMRQASHSPLHPLSPDVAWGRLFVVGTAALVLVVGMIAAWSYDGRAETVISPELQAELDQLRAQAAANPEDAGPIAAQISAALAAARAQGARPTSGISTEGPGLGLWTLVFGLAGVGASLFAVGMFGVEERKLWFWNSVTAGIGSGVAAIPFAWIFTHVRSADPGFVSGVGSFLTMCGGFFLLASTMTVLKEFRRAKVYDDEPAASGTDMPASELVDSSA